MTFGGRLLRLVSLPAAAPVRPGRAAPGSVALLPRGADMGVVGRTAGAMTAPPASADDAQPGDPRPLVSLTGAATSIVELQAALRMVAEGQARRMTLAGFPFQADALPEIVAAARERGVRIIPTIAYGGGSVDIAVERDERPGE